jgi:hypothetical protein
MSCLLSLVYYYSFQSRGKYAKNYFDVVLTLDPNKIGEKKQKRLHIGNMASLGYFVALHEQSKPVLAHRLYYENNSKSGTLIHKPYPPDIKAFLYYSTSPIKPRIAGELRFRIARSDDPASFESGSDLLKSDGQPWSRPLFVLSKSYTHLYKKLVEDRLVPDDLDAALSTFATRFPKYDIKQLFYTLNDTFIVEFSRLAQYFFVITEQGMDSLNLSGLFVDFRGGTKCKPYTGAYTNHHLSILLD